MSSLSHLILAPLLAWFTGLQQESPAPWPEEMLLGIDELIERLPCVGEEWLPESFGSTAWKMRPAAAEMQRRLEQGKTLTEQQWRRALTRTGALRLRERWPADHPFAVSMREPAWLGVMQIRFVPRREGLRPAEVGELLQSTCGTYGMSMYQAWLYQELGSLPVGRQRLVFEVTIERGVESELLGRMSDPPRHAPPPGILWRGLMTFETEIVATVDEAIPPRSSPELDAAVRGSMSLAFDDWANGRTAILVLDPDVANGSHLAKLGLSLQIDVLRRGEKVGELKLLANVYDPLAGSNSVHGGRNQPIAFCAPDCIPAALEDDAEELEAWSLRVRGTSDHVWLLWEAEARWGGELEVTLADLVRREKELAPEGRGSWIWFPTFR
jgi:hypothetical protein